MMQKVLTVAALVSCVAAVDFTNPVNDRELIQAINSNPESTWVAHESPRFMNHTLEDVSRLCGTVMKGTPGYFELPAKQGSESELVAASIPDNFDGRQHFTACADVIGHVRDQSSCGSCWAFGSTEAFNDRNCIANGDKTLLSPEDTVACCGLFQCMSMGCNGGQPSAAWNWFTNTGVVTGGDYDDLGKGDTCEPYSMAPCAHHVTSPKYQPCPSKEYPTPSCAKTCQSGYSKSYTADKVKAKSSYSLSGVSQIQTDIMTYGSVTGAFTVYADFPTYKSGVYTHQSGSELGGHAIKIIGWGVENGVDYWLVVNSWNDSWGDQGLFKIKRGTNECGIESQISAGHA
jgi:cathepsin B